MVTPLLRCQGIESVCAIMPFLEIDEPGHLAVRGSPGWGVLALWVGRFAARLGDPLGVWSLEWRRQQQRARHNHIPRSRVGGSCQWRRKRRDRGVRGDAPTRVHVTLVARTTRAATRRPRANETLARARGSPHALVERGLVAVRLEAVHAWERYIQGRREDQTEAGGGRAASGRRPGGGRAARSEQKNTTCGKGGSATDDEPKNAPFPRATRGKEVRSATTTNRSRARRAARACTRSGPRS